jgi:transposase
MLLSVRELLVRQRTQMTNAVRGHAAEMGAVAPLGEKGVREPAGRRTILYLTPCTKGAVHTRPTVLIPTLIPTVLFLLAWHPRLSRFSFPFLLALPWLRRSPCSRANVRFSDPRS